MNNNITLLSIAVALIANAFFILKIQKKGDEDMAIIYATLIIRGKKDFSEVPERLKAQVKQILIDLELGYLAEEKAGE